MEKLLVGMRAGGEGRVGMKGLSERRGGGRDGSIDVGWYNLVAEC